MPNQKQLQLLKQSIHDWNKWRYENPKVKINLTNANLSGLDLNGADFFEANLSGVNFKNSHLEDSNFNRANLIEANFTNAKLENSSFVKAELSNLRFKKFLFKYNEFGDYSFTPQTETDLDRRAKFAKADLGKVDFRETNLIGVDFSDSCLRYANFEMANLTWTIFNNADLSGANLVGANLYEAKLIEACLNEAILCETLLSKADFRGARLNNASLAESFLTDVNFREAQLIGANLTGANLFRANLTGADLTESDLQNASLVEACIENAVLKNSKVYGISAWAVRGTPKNQSNLIITYKDAPIIKVDDLQVAQFIFLLLDNRNIRNLVNIITSKAVLILGRFTDERKIVLDLIREELPKYGYVPILFDFENSMNQSLLETIMTVAGMSHFIIADVTNATMVREELRSIIEKYPSKPIQPILLESEKEYVTLPEMMVAYKSILPTFYYERQDEVIIKIEENIITPAENWLEERKNRILGGNKTVKEIELEKQIEILREELKQKEKTSSANTPGNNGIVASGTGLC